MHGTVEESFDEATEPTFLATQPTGQLVDYGITDDLIEIFKAKYGALTCDTKDGYEQTRLAIGVLRGARGKIEKRRKELKADALEWGRKVDAEAKRVTAIIEEIEEPLVRNKLTADDVIAQTKRQKELAEQQAKELAERAQREADEAKRKAEWDALAAERAAMAAEKARQEEEQRVLREQLAAERAEMERKRRAFEIEEAQRKAKIEAQQQAERDRIAQEEARVREAERQAQLQKRLAALRPDVEKIRAWGEALKGVIDTNVPDVAAEEAKAVVHRAKTDLHRICNDLADFTTN